MTPRLHLSWCEAAGLLSHEAVVVVKGDSPEWLITDGGDELPEVGAVVAPGAVYGCSCIAQRLSVQGAGCAWANRGSCVYPSPSVELRCEIES
jgi:hypothetical protein